MQSNQDIISYNHQIREKLIEINQPLLDRFNLNFGYTRVYFNGSYYDLRPESHFIEHHYANDLMSKGSFFLTELTHITANDVYMSLWPTTWQDPFLNFLYECNIWQGFEIYEKHQDYLEIWTFAATREQDLRSNFYINNTAHLKSFIFYFKERASKLIDANNIGSLPCSDIYQHHFTKLLLDNSPHTIQKNNNKLFPIKRYQLIKNGKNYFLTPRETQCLVHLSAGKSAKEIARALGLSPRTVERYLEDIKDKLHCSTKSELIHAFFETPLRPDPW